MSLRTSISGRAGDGHPGSAYPPNLGRRATEAAIGPEPPSWGLGEAVDGVLGGGRGEAGLPADGVVRRGRRGALGGERGLAVHGPYRAWSLVSG